MDYRTDKTVIEFCTVNPLNRKYFYSQLELPASDGAVYDALQKARAVGRDKEIDISVINSPYLPELADTLIDGINIWELNMLAEKLEELYRDDYSSLEKLNALFLYRKEQGFYEDGVSLSELLNMTYGLDNVTCYSDIENTENLGEMLIDQRMTDGIVEVTDQNAYYLDKKQIAQTRISQKKGLFYEGNYYETADFKMPNVYKPDEQPKKDYSDLKSAFRLLMMFGNSEEKWVDLPTEKREFENGRCIGYETAVPQIKSAYFYETENFTKLNAIAKAFMAMSERQRVAFKAVLQAEKISDIDEVIETAKNISDYEIEPYAYAEPDFFQAYLMHFLDSRFDTAWLYDTLSDTADQMLLKKLNAKFSDYGIISARNQPLYSIVPFDEPDESDEIDCEEVNKMNLGGC